MNVNISGYSDDIVEVAINNDGYEPVEEEYDSYGQDTLFEFEDGTRLRMTYRGAWMAVLEKRGTAKVRIEPLVTNDDWYTDLVVVEAWVKNMWKEAPRDGS